MSFLPGRLFHKKSHWTALLLLAALFYVANIYRYDDLSFKLVRWQGPGQNLSLSEFAPNPNSNVTISLSQPQPPIIPEPRFILSSNLTVTVTVTGTSQPEGKSTNAQACEIPQLPTFPEEVKFYIKKKEKPLQTCDKYFPLLFESTLDGVIKPTKSLEEFRSAGIKDCCYNVVAPKSRRGVLYTLSEECHALSLETPTEIPPEHEFIAIKCRNGSDSESDSLDKPSTPGFFSWVNRVMFSGAQKKGPEEQFVDMHSFIPIRPEWRKENGGAEAGNNGSSQLNVVIFGMDATSRLNFLRMMPQSYKYLMEELGAVDMAGYNKIGDNTFPNMMPMLASMYESDLRAGCGKRKRFDTCPFIWNEFKSAGYATSYAEDATYISIFNNGRINNGFDEKPVDYYLMPWSLAADYLVRKLDLLTKCLCHGPRLCFTVLLDNMRKFVSQMGRAGKPGFHFTWTTSLTHDYLSGLALGEEEMLKALRWMKDEGHLENTVLILMSDHGSRVGAFRNTGQGRVEDRLPLFFMVLPEWMREGEYSKAFENLRGNQQRLVTTFDFHSTLMDLLNYRENLLRPEVKRRSEELLKLEKEDRLPLNISLFLPVPQGRTCYMAGIEGNFCSCKYLHDIPTNDTGALRAAQAGIEKLNKITSRFSRCARLKLKGVHMAQQGIEFLGKGKGSVEVFQVTFDAEPGDGMFEALVAKKKGGEKGQGSWEVKGTISRTNLYGEQSRCVKGIKSVKEYCYCVQ